MSSRAFGPRNSMKVVSVTALFSAPDAPFDPVFPRSWLNSPVNSTSLNKEVECHMFACQCRWTELRHRHRASPAAFPIWPEAAAAQKWSFKKAVSTMRKPNFIIVAAWVLHLAA